MSHLNTLLLHRLRYGELDGDALREARAHLDDCALCAGRLRGQEAERAAFVAAPVPESIRKLAQPRRPWWVDWVSLGGVVLAAAAVSLVVREIRTSPTSEVLEDTVRFRGELPALEVWVKRPEGARPLHPGEPVVAGDRVQLVYDPHGASVIALAGRDGSGSVEVWTTNAPTGIGLIRAPFALTLDDTPGAQELFVVGSERALTEAEVKEAVTRGVQGVRVGRVTLAKGEAKR